MADISHASTRLKTLLHTIRDDLGRSLDSLRQDLAGSELPHVQVNNRDVKAAALYLRDVGLKHDGLRLHGEFAQLCNRCMDEWFASMADGKSQEYRDELTELFGPFPSQGNPDDSIVADRRVAIAGRVAQLLEFLDGLMSTVAALPGELPVERKGAGTGADAERPGGVTTESAGKAAEPLDAAGGGDGATEEADTPWVPAHTLWKDKFTTNKELAKFRKEHPRMFRNPSPRRLEIHAGLWALYWAARDKAGFEALDGDLPSLADDPDAQEVFLEGAAKRLKKLQAEKKQDGKR